MKDNKNKLKKPESTEQSLVAVEACGKDSELWAEHNSRFITRLLNSVKNVFNNDIPPKATADNEIHDAIDNAADGLNEKLKGPKLVNQERQANIYKILAEAKEREAAARKLSLESDMIEMELERQKVHESQKMISLLIQRGELKIIEKDGETLFILNQ